MTVLRLMIGKCRIQIEVSFSCGSGQIATLSFSLKTLQEVSLLYLFRWWGNSHLYADCQGISSREREGSSLGPRSGGPLPLLKKVILAGEQRLQAFLHLWVFLSLSADNCHGLRLCKNGLWSEISQQQLLAPLQRFCRSTTYCLVNAFITHSISSFSFCRQPVFVPSSAPNLKLQSFITYYYFRHTCLWVNRSTFQWNILTSLVKTP